MGPQTLEDEEEAIELAERPPAEGKDEDDWIDSEQNMDESDVMLRPEPDGRDGDEDTGGRISKTDAIEADEGFWLITFQVFFPFLVAGLGMVGAGLVLDIVQVSYFISILNFNNIQWFFLFLSALECFSSSDGAVYSRTSSFRAERKLGNDVGVSPINSSQSWPPWRTKPAVELDQEQSSTCPGLFIKK